MDYEKIGLFIQQRRKELKLTQKELANLIGVTDKAVSKWERGLGCPDVSILGELSSALDIGIGELLNGEIDQKLKDNDEFIKNAVLFSKNNTQSNIYKKLSYIFSFVIGILGLYLVFMNVLQISYLNTKTEYYFSDSEMNILQSKYDLIKSNIQKLASLEVEDETYKKVLVSSAQNFLLSIDGIKILNYRGATKLSIMEITNISHYIRNAIRRASFMLSMYEDISNTENELYPTLKNFSRAANSLSYSNDNVGYVNDKYYDVDLYFYNSISFDKADIYTLLNNLETAMDAYNEVLVLIIKEVENA